MNLKQKIESVPFLRILLPLILGILVADSLEVSAAVILSILLVVAIGVMLLRTDKFLIIILVFLVGVTSVKIHYEDNRIPRNVRVALSCALTDNVVSIGKWYRTTAKAHAFRVYDDTLAHWTTCNEGIQIYIDSTYNVEMGDSIGCVGYVNELDTVSGESSYARTMLSRGIRGKFYVLAGRLVKGGKNKELGIVAASKYAQLFLSERLRKIDYNEKESAVAVALLTGEKRLLDKITREEYSKAGVSHILAISGLHLGIIFLILNYVLAPLVFVRHGKLIRALAVILILWAYAFVSGCSASVLRSAFMLSVVQLSMMTVWSHSSYNALFASAFVLLIVNPYFIYDISFQMSYLALLSILFFYKRFYRWSGVSKLINRIKYKEKGKQRFKMITLRMLLSFVAGTMMLGIAAQIGVMPLTGYIFGRLPLANILINPLIMLTVTIIMVTGFAYLVTQWFFVGEIFAKMLEFQNDIVLWTSKFNYASIESVQFSDKVLYLTYFFLLVTVVVIKWIEDRKKITINDSY